MTTPQPNAPAVRTLSGKCWCGATEYEVADEFLYAESCHCSRCRRATGSAFKPFAGIERSKLRVTRGEDALLRLGDDLLCDVRCGKCGSLLYSIVRDGEYAHVALGSLVDEPSIRLSKHIFVGSKASWETLCDGLPQYRGHVADEPLAASSVDTRGSEEPL